MTKSEMVDFMTETLLAKCCGRRINDKEAMYILLDSMIEKGILPPKTVNPSLRGNYSSYLEFLEGGVHHENHIDYDKKYYVNEWDD